MRSLFLLSYLFPPIGGIGSMRMTKFARYLPEFGWMPTVFHAGKGNLYVQDPSLLDELPPNLERIPVRTLEGAAMHKALRKVGLAYVSFRLPMLLPIDGQIGWVPGLLRETGRRIDEGGGPDAVFSTSAPYSTTLAGLWLKRRYRLPWVADFRDDWTRHPHVRFVTPAHRRLARAVELRTLAEADAVTTVTQTWADEFQTDRPPDRRPVDLVPNGFDESDFAHRPPPKLTDKFTLAFVGSAYAMTDPAQLVDALAELVREGVIPGDRVRVVHAGSGKIRPPAGKSFELQSEGFVSHGEAVRWMQRAHLLLFACHRPEAVSGRIYEYIRSGTPILGVAPEGEATRIVAETGRGVILTPDRHRDMRKQLVERYREWCENPNLPDFKPGPEITRYSRREQARRLAEILDAAVTATSPRNAG